MAAIPKPASTVVLLDNSNRVYMTKRPQAMQFLGGYFVFPGGALEKTDEQIDSHYIRNEHGEYDLHPSYYIAAARELYEEIGILLCEKGEDDDLLIQTEYDEDYRRQLLNSEISFLQLLKKESLLLNVSKLMYFGNFVTPERSPIRFNTHFFLAYLPEGQEPDPDAYEIEEGLWITPDEALSACKSGSMPMVLPTITTLKAIQNYLNGNPLKMPEIILE